MNRDRGVLPGEEMLEWLPLSTLTLMAINDHFLRETWPCWLTGKLSDFAAVLCVPFLLTATYAWSLFLFTNASNFFLRFTGRRGTANVRYELTKMRLLVALLVTSLTLLAINLTTFFRDIYVDILVLIDVFGIFGSFRYTIDPSDCLALLVAPIAWWFGLKVIERQQGKKRAVAECETQRWNRGRDHEKSVS